MSKADVLDMWWWRGGKFNNLGDEITPHIINHQWGCAIQRSGFKKGVLIGAGSILELALAHSKGVPLDIWGSGFMFSASKFAVKPERDIKFHAVRGLHTKDRIHGLKSVVCGDPGLLAIELLYDRRVPDYVRQDKRYTLGLVPHYVDQQHPMVQKLQNDKDVLYINVKHNPKDVVQQMDQCEFIISSSLHGLIIADSLGIPNVMVELSKKIAGNGFKYRDYYSVFRMEPPLVSIDKVRPHTIRGLTKGYERPNIESVKRDLLESFPSREDGRCFKI